MTAHDDALSNDLENKLIEHIVKRATWAMPTTIEVSLHDQTGKPDDASAGSEVSVSGYARAVTTASDWTRSGRVVQNANDIYFTFDSAPSDDIDGVVLWKNGTEYMLYHEFASDVNIFTASTWEISAGAITFAWETEAQEGDDDNVSDWFAGKLLDHMFMQASYTPPEVWVGLSQDQGSSWDGTYTGSDANEPLASDGYVRQQVEGTADWNAANAGLVDNKDFVEFGPITDFYTVYTVFLSDSGTHNSGNIYCYGNIGTSSNAHNIGDDVDEKGGRFGVGDLNIKVF